MFVRSNNKISENFINFISFLYFLNLLLTVVFMRSYVGIKIFGFRIGEILIGFCLLVIFILFFKKLRNIFEISNEFLLIKCTQIIIGSFFVIVALNQNFNFSLSILKTSSYIWSLGYLFAGYYFLSKLNLKFVTILFAGAVFSSYFITFINYPNFVMDFFIKFSDKFQFIKAADTLLILVLFNFLIKRCKLETNKEFLIFLISSSLFIPYFFVQSRGSVLAAVIFVILNLFNYKKYITNNVLRFILGILLSVISFYFSSYFLSGIDFSSEERQLEVVEVNEAIKNEVVKKKNISKGFLTFYFEDGRIYSVDNTTNWRLDIWQDLVEDLVNKNKLFFGFGYEGVYEIMLDPTAPGRLGRDGLNENVHNYFFNILGRGGLFQLVLFLYFYLLLFKRWTRSHGVLDFFIFFTPLLVVSSLDVTMEGVQFPLIFFSIIGYLLSLDYYKKV